jgi:hypothetical protein
MPSKFAVAFRACCLAVILLHGAMRGAETRPNPLLGATREQVLKRLGEPKSQIVTGNHEVLFFERERLDLVDNVVVEVEALAAQPAVRPAAPPTASTPDATAPPGNATAPDAGSRAPAAAVPPTESEPSVQIRAIRSRNDAASEPALHQNTEGPRVAPVRPAAPAATAPATTPADQSAPRSNVGQPAKADDEVAPPEKPTAQPPKKSIPFVPRPAVSPSESTLPEVSLFTTQTYVIATVVIFGGLGYLIWRSRQRTLELAATTVSQTPFTFTPPTDSTRFSEALLGRLDTNRFEALVVSYYSKTGVVAERTKAAPSAGVQIRISWKGESRPFACVQCIAHPEAPVDTPRLKELLAVLTAEDIRRGYVVTTGEFSPAAREYAEEKHITLMSGNVLLEKLNALPEVARKELLREIAAGERSHTGA